MMSLTFGLFTQVSCSGPLGPLVLRHPVLDMFLAHLSQRLRVSYCHQPMSVVRRVSSTIASNDISSETARPRTLIFGM